MTVKCPKCQTDNPSDSKYCKECATPLPPSRDLDFSQTKTLETPIEKELPRGTTFAGRYEIIEELGHGGMGKVYKVFDKETNSKVALKLIKPEVAADKSTIERFRNELKVARDISHKHICRMYDLGREADNYFITMEYVSGEDLRSLIRRTRRLDIGTAISITKQVGEGLAEAHRIGVIHRDLKPSNIMIDREGDAKIMDFGIARSLRTKGITGPGVVIGTPEYMSPEQVDGKEADQRADLYSLCIILYEMVTGTVPFEGETAFAVGLKQKSEPPENPKKLNPQIPDDLSRLILKGLEKEKEKRYQSAAEVVSELTRIEHGLPTAEKAVPKRKPLTSKEITVKFSLRKLIIPAIAVAVVAIGAVLLVFLSNRQPPKQPIVPSHKQLTFTGEATYPAISPDGKFIAYVTGQQEIGQKVWVQDVASGHSIEVFSAESCRILCWTPDGSEITVWARKDSKPGTFLVPRLGGPSHPIEKFQFVSWSPDGAQFAGANWTSKDIKIVNKLTGNSTFIQWNEPSRWVNAIDWSPSGDRLLVFKANYEKGNRYSIWTVKSDGSQQNKVIEDIYQIYSPRWANRGNAIFYLRGKWTTGGVAITELWKLPISPNTGKPNKPASLILSGIPMGDSFSLSADEKCLTYTRTSRFSNLLLAQVEESHNARTVKIIQLTSGTQLDSSPSISPDGKRVVFSRGSGRTSNIYTMPIEGRNPTQITFLNSINSFPVWSRDGREIAFGSDEGGKISIWKVSSQGGVPFKFTKTELADIIASPIIWSPSRYILYNKIQDGPQENWHILDPMTEHEAPLRKDGSIGEVYGPCISPDGKKVVVSNLWVTSIDDYSEKFLKVTNKKDIGDPTGWSEDGKWIYTKRGKTEHLRIELKSGRVEALPTIPFTISGKTYFMIDCKPQVIVDSKTQSDVWVVENFDQIIK